MKNLKRIFSVKKALKKNDVKIDIHVRDQSGYI